MAWWVILIHNRNLAELGRFREPLGSWWELWCGRFSHGRCSVYASRGMLAGYRYVFYASGCIRCPGWGADWVLSPALGHMPALPLARSWFGDLLGALVRAPWDNCGNRGVARSRALMTHWLCITGHVGGHLGFSCLGLHILLVEVLVESQSDTPIETGRVSTDPSGECGRDRWLPSEPRSEQLGLPPRCPEAMGILCTSRRGVG